MARLPEITDKQDMPPDKRPIFDQIASSRGRIGFPFSLLLNSPEVAGRTAHLGSYIRFESVLSPVNRELAIITTSREFDCRFEWAFHAPLALEAGVRREAIDVVANHGDLDSLTADEAMIIGYGRELFRDHRVSDETFRIARARIGDKGITELTATFGYYAMLACTLNALEAEPPADRPRLP